MSYRDVIVRRQCAVALFTLLIVQWGLSSLVSAQMVITPSLSVAERYDSNIFYTPKSLLNPGSKPEDFVTMVVPQMNLGYKGSLISGNLVGTGIVTKYIHNPNRDFTGYNAGGVLNLTNAAHQLSQRITSLTMTGRYRSTPTGTGFGAAGGGLNTGFGSSEGGALNSGIVTNRASRQIYNLMLAGGYQLTGLTTLNADFTFTAISFGEQQGGANNPLFNTIGYRGMTGIFTRTSPTDTVGATSTMSHFVQEQSSGGSGQGTYTTIGEMLSWNRRWTPELNSFLSGGANFKLPVGSNIPGQSQPTQVRPIVMARITYLSYSEELRDAASFGGPFDDYNSPSLAASSLAGTSLAGGGLAGGGLAGTLMPGGIVPRGQYMATMMFRYTLSPSYAFTAGPQQTQVLSLMARGGITSKLTGTVGMNYAHRDSLSSSSTTGDTVGVSVGAQYLLGPVLTSLTYSWLHVSNTTPQNPEYEFSKKMVTLLFSFAFASPEFFREGISLPSGSGTRSSQSEDGSETLR